MQSDHASPRQALIEVRGLRRELARRVLIDDVSFDVPAGSVTLMLGPNGAGKSSILRTVAGTLRAQVGQVRIAGHDLQHEPAQARSVLGFAPERPALYPEMTPIELLAFVCRLRGLPEPQAACEEALTTFALEAVGHRTIDRLSQGYRRRVALAAASLHKPKVLVLDEPASGLDPLWRVQLHAWVRAQAERGASVLIATHELADAEFLADAILVLRDGRIADHFSPRDTHVHELCVHLAMPVPELPAILEQIEGVSRVCTQTPTLLLVRATRDVRADVVAATASRGLLALVPQTSVTTRVLHALGAP